MGQERLEEDFHCFPILPPSPSSSLPSCPFQVDC
jgi:hypothetical protein